MELSDPFTPQSLYFREKKKPCIFGVGRSVSPRAVVYIFGKEKYLMPVPEFEPRIVQS